MRISVLFALIGFLSIQPVFSQSGTVRGTVTDSSGEPLQGATITVKGTNNGVVSDASGNYQINNVTDNNAVLSVSFVGFVTKEITVGSQTVINVVLDEDILLDEVVVVGYGTQKKASLTGSVATVNVSEIRAIPTGNLTTALAGRLTGVTIAQTSGGRPGNSAATTIRSKGTWNSATPLYVIDGVARDSRAFDVLNANDIATFSVLKDAAAATIYGARAANGVFLITTRRGQEGKTQVNYSGSVSIGSFAFEVERQSMESSIRMANNLQMEYRQGRKPTDDGSYVYAPMYSSIYKNGVNDSEGYINSNVLSNDEQEYYRRTGGYSTYDAVYRRPVTNNHSLNISGGTDKVKYFAGASFYNEPGIAEALNYRKYSIRTNLDAKLTKNLTASVDLNTDYSLDSRPAGEGVRADAIYGFMVRKAPFIPVKVGDKYIGGGTNNTDDNLLARAEGAAGTHDVNYWHTEYTASLKWDIQWIQGLSAKISYNQYNRHALDKEHSRTYLVYATERDGVNNHIYLDAVDETKAPTTRGTNFLDERRNNEKSYQFNGIITYNNTFGKHDVGAMLAYEQYENSGERQESKITGMIVSSLPYFEYGEPNNGTNYYIGGYGWEDARLSYIGRFKYCYDNRYLAEFSFRRDASVKFDPEYRWGFFPSGSAAWRVSEESFFKDNISFISNLKLRGSVGLTGNDDVGGWQWMDRVDASQTGALYGGSALTPGSSFSAIANPLITWEKSLSYNGGLEMGFLGNTITFGAEYFFRKTYDILGPQTSNLPDTFGGSIADANYGIVNSFGYEFELGFDKQINKNLAVWAKGNFGWADNKIVEWAEPGVLPHLSRIGKNWDRKTGWRSDGIIWSIEPDGVAPDGAQTFRITTSTGHTYNNVHDKYAYDNPPDAGKYFVTNNDYSALRPGCIFPVDLNGVDADGNVVPGPDGFMNSGDIDRDWKIEHYNPPYNYGLLLGAEWKGISLEVLLQGTAGNQISIQMSDGAGSGIDAAVQGWWAADAYSYNDNPTGKFPITVNGASKPWTDFWVRDASFLRLKNVNLAYSFPKKLLSKLGLSGAKVYVSGYNLALLWNAAQYVDPELVTPVTDINLFVKDDTLRESDTNAMLAHSLGTYPLIRTITFGLNLSF
jgi:TonB-linked SusC/RagA family outer membrane protein